jgi:hypothetical protein
MKCFLAAAVFAFSLSAFDGDPWVIEPLKPDVKALYSYGFFSNIEGYNSNYKNNQFLLSLDVAFPNHFQLGIELDQDASTFRNFYFRAAAIELKKQFSDDVAEGDMFGIACGMRGIAQTAYGRLDPATLYPGGYHFIGYVSLGKEWSWQAENFVRFWVLGGLGVATHASLWAEFEAHILYRNLRHELKINAVSNIGYGATTYVDIYDFNGWGHLRYRYIDLGFTYGYEIAKDLFLKAGFSKRALGQVMPSNYNYFNLVLEKIF